MKAKKKSKDKTIIYVLLIVLFELFMYVIEPYVSNHITLFFILLTILSIIGYIFYCKKHKSFNYKTLTFLLIMIGVLLRTMYMFKTTIYERQHDVFDLSVNGHMKYIYDLVMTGRLPSTNDFQFYHPPLFHALAAIWVKINTMLGISIGRAFEGIQVLTAIFSSLSMIVTYKIIDRIKLQDKTKFVLNAFMASFPTFIIISGSINNDCLLMMLSFMTILYIMKWFENPDWKNTIILALITGLSVMTKLNGAIMAVPILYVFIKKLIECYKKDKKRIKPLIYKILVFAIISLPIGLWFQVREIVLFGSNSVPHTTDPSQDLSMYSIFERFFTISFDYLKNVFLGIFSKEYSVLSNIFKTSLFSEYVFYQSRALCAAMLTFNIVLVITSTFYIIKYIFNKKEHNNYLNILVITWGINIISYIIFNIKYPASTTMDFRYIIPTVLTGIILLCINIFNKKSIINIMIKLCLYLFIILCLIFPYTI